MTSVLTIDKPFDCCLNKAKTTAALKFIARRQAAGEMVAIIDVNKSFDVEAAKDAGVCLKTLLVSRPKDLAELQYAWELLAGADAIDALVIDYSPHP